MRTAILSDIHGNLEALELTLADIETRQVDRSICLGDLVEGGTDNDRVVALIQNLSILTVQGNHDLINDCHLHSHHQSWLNQLPETFIEKDVVYTHISPRIPRRAISNHIQAWNIFDETSFRLTFVGHIHFPVIYGCQCESFGESQVYEVDEGKYDLDLADRYIICFGAIGYPRGGGKFIRYGIYDESQQSLEFIKLEGTLLPYGLCAI